MKEKRYNHIKDNIHLLDIDYEKGKVLNKKIWQQDNGYVYVNFGCGTAFVHQLIAFLKYDKGCIGLTVNHINGIKTDNRPENLELLTRGDNVRHGMVNGFFDKNRVKGSNHYYSVLNEDQVVQIKLRLMKGDLQKAIAKDFNVHKNTINEIAVGRNWLHVHVEGFVPTKKAYGRLTEVDVTEIKQRLKTGNETNVSIAADYSVDPRTISEIKRGNTWKHVK